MLEATLEGLASEEIAWYPYPLYISKVSQLFLNNLCLRIENNKVLWSHCLITAHDL